MRIPVLCFGPVVETAGEPGASGAFGRASAAMITAAEAEKARTTISAHKLEKQFEWLVKNGFQTPILTDFIERRLETDATARRTILTFDGGLEAHYRLVLPLLQKYELRATFFVAPETFEKPGGLARGEVEIMSRWGMGFGILAPHADELAKLSSQELQSELTVPRRRLEDAIGRAVREIAVPGPRIETSPLVRPIYEAGYRGLATYTLGNHFEQDDMIIVARYVVRGRTVHPEEWKNVVRMSSHGPAKFAFFVRPLK